MRVVAIVAAFNEERFIGACFDNLASQDVSSTSATTDPPTEPARSPKGSAAVGWSALNDPSRRHLHWRELLRRKEVLAATLEGTGSCTSIPTRSGYPPIRERARASASSSPPDACQRINPLHRG